MMIMFGFVELVQKFQGISTVMIGIIIFVVVIKRWGKAEEEN